MLTVYKREMGAYFRSPVAYCIIGFFMVMVGLFFWINNIMSASVDFTVTLRSIALFLVFIAPIITMKLLADEKRNGTEVLLQTSPVPMWKIVCGKFFSAVSLYTIMLLLTLVYPMIMSFLVKGTLPHAETLAGYIGFWFVGVSFISVGLLTSAFTESQVVAAVTGIVALLCVYFMQSIGTSVGGTFGAILQWISPLAKFDDFAAGTINFASIVFYITFPAVLVYITIMYIERKRWN